MKKQTFQLRRAEDTLKNMREESAMGEDGWRTAGRKAMRRIHNAAHIDLFEATEETSEAPICLTAYAVTCIPKADAKEAIDR